MVESYRLNASKTSRAGVCGCAGTGNSVRLGGLARGEYSCQTFRSLTVVSASCQCRWWDFRHFRKQPFPDDLQCLYPIPFGRLLCPGAGSGAGCAISGPSICQRHQKPVPERNSGRRARAVGMTLAGLELHALGLPFMLEPVPVVFAAPFFLDIQQRNQRQKTGKPEKKPLKIPPVAKPANERNNQKACHRNDNCPDDWPSGPNRQRKRPDAPTSPNEKMITKAATSISSQKRKNPRGPFQDLLQMPLGSSFINFPFRRSSRRESLILDVLTRADSSRNTGLLRH